MREFGASAPPGPLHDVEGGGAQVAVVGGHGGSLMSGAGALGDDPGHVLHARDPPLGGVEVEPVERRAHRELEHRDAPGDQVPDGGVAVLLAQLARIHAVGLHSHEGLGHEALVLLEGAQRGLLPGGVAVDIAEKKGLTVIREAFADRNYNPDGTLVSRKEANAVLGSADEVVQRVLEVAQTGSITAVDGTKLEVDAQSVCTHGDSPGAVKLLRGVVERLREEGIEIRSFI